MLLTRQLTCHATVLADTHIIIPVSTGMGDRLRVGIPPWYVTKLTRSTQPCIPLGSLNRVPALIGWGKGGNVTSAGWQVILCDPIWHVSSCSGEACCELLYPATLLLLLVYYPSVNIASALVWQQRHSSHQTTQSTLSTVSTVIDGGRYITSVCNQLTRSTQPCILLGLLNRLKGKDKVLLQLLLSIGPGADPASDFKPSTWQ